MRTPIELKIPDIGNYHDVEIIEIAIHEGEHVAQEDTLLTLETDKASIDVPASTAGQIMTLNVKVGDRVSKDRVFATLEPSENAKTNANPTAAALSTPADSGPAASTSDTQQTASTSTAEHTLKTTAATHTENRSEKVAGPQTRVPPAVSSNRPDLLGNDQTAKPIETRTQDVHAGPSARQLARHLGVDLCYVSGTGPKGRILREDVQAYVKQALQQPRKVQPQSDELFEVAAWPKIDFSEEGPIEQKALTRIQKRSGTNLSRNWVRIPHVTQFDEADITDLEAFRQQTNAESVALKSDSPIKLTPLAFLIKAVVVALKKFPEFNASLNGESLICKHYYNIGFAVEIPQGLVVPVIRDADKKGVGAIAQETAHLAQKAREGALKPEEMQKGTFTLSSLGGIGGIAFTPIINAPEVAILGISKAKQQPVWLNNAFVPRLILPLSLSYDHRVIDGAAGARFSSYLALVLGDIRRLIL